MKTDILVLFYKTASRKIIKTINAGTPFNRARKLATLKEIDVILGELDKKTNKWVSRELKTSYLQGKKDTQSLLKKTGVSINVAFNKIDEEAVKVLVGDTQYHFAEAISGVKRYSSRLLNNATKERIKAILIEGRISGETKKLISNKIAGELKQGFIALKDKAGKNWKIDTYADMLAQTKMTESTNQGLQNQLLEEDYDLVQVTSHGTKCDLCGPWEGEILSISGNSKEYKSVDEAEGAGLFHPRCQHRLVPYHESFAKQSKQWSSDLQKYI